MHRLLYLVLAAALFVPACSYAPVAKVYPLADIDGRLPTDHVEVYPHPDSLTRPHQEIAIIKAVSSERVHQPNADDTKYLDALKQKAREIGADAIVVFRQYGSSRSGPREPKKVTSVADLPNTPESIREVYVKAIVYTSRWPAR